MAVTVADVYGPDPGPGGWHVCKKVTFDSSYAGGGGEALTHAQLGFSRAPDVVKVEDNTPSGYVIKYDNANEKLIAYWANYPGAAAGVLTEVTGTTDLHTVSVYVEAVGELI